MERKLVWLGMIQKLKFFAFVAWMEQKIDGLKDSRLQKKASL
jgi:hypothetical protein